MRKRKIAVLLLLGLLILGGISSAVNEVANVFRTLLDSYKDEISTAYDGDGGGPGLPTGGGTGGGGG